MDPTPLEDEDETYDGLGERLQPRYIHRDPMQTRKHKHRNRNRNRQLSVLIVNIETDAQTE